MVRSEVVLNMVVIIYNHKCSYITAIALDKALFSTKKYLYFSYF